MSKRDRPFAIYKRPSGMITIVPRGILGWLQVLVWLGLLGALWVWFIDHFTSAYDTTDWWSAVLFVCGLVAWLICFLWWVHARAEVIDTEVWRRDQYRKRQKKRRKQE